MTSRELLALAVRRRSRRSPRALVALAPRRLARPRRVAGALVDRGALRARARGRRARRLRRAPFVGDWLVVDAAGGLLVGVIGVVGLASVLVSPAYLGPRGDSLVSAERRPTDRTSSLLFAFWAVLLAVPLAGNLGAAWLLVEATTAASALLVGFSGKPRALEAGWKYLILTSLGLGVALLGIVAPRGRRRAAAGSSALSWRALATYCARPRAPRSSPTCSCSPGSRRRSAGRRCTTGCPTPTRRRPPPVSALLSAALLPAVLLVAWRSRAGARAGRSARAPRRRVLSASGSSRSPSPCRSSGGRWPGSGCSPTRASSTWA